MTKIDPIQNIITAIAVLTPGYIVDHFGNFGKPTVKNQLIINEIARQMVLGWPDQILYYDDNMPVGTPQNINQLHGVSIHDQPTPETLLPLSTIRQVVINSVIGQSIAPAATKNRGQMLEILLAKALGYTIQEGELLAGGYPDIPNQALEIKIQDSPTVDLGKYSPEFEAQVPGCNGFTTRSIRYLIALTNPITNIIEGVILCPGGKLGSHFTYVPRESYKCQRAIPMDFFNTIVGKSVFNPQL